MSFNIVDMAKEALGKEIASKMGAALGENPDQIGEALKTAIPFILGAIANKGSDKEGAGQLLDMVGKLKIDSDAGIGSMLSSLTGDNKDAMLSQGTNLLKTFLGSDSKVSTFLEMFNKSSNLKGGSAGGLLQLLSPLLMGAVGRYAKSKALGALGFSNMLSEQKSVIAKELPAGLAGGLGIASSVSGSAAAAANSGATAAKSGGGLFSKLLPLLLILGALFFFFRSCGSQAPLDNTTYKTNEAVDMAGMKDKMAAATNVMAEKAEAAGKGVGGLLGKATDAMGSVADAASNAAGDAAGAVEGAATAASGAASEMMDKLTSLSLPGGSKIDAPEGSFTQKFAEYLESDTPLLEGGSESFAFDRINFQTGSALLTEESATQVDNFGAILRAYPNVKIRVEGHTDNTGNAVANKNLSAERAKSVRNALSTKNVNSQRVEAVGFGQENPIADNSTEEGRAQNRRVTITVTAK